MKEHLERLIQQVQKDQLVERLMSAKSLHEQVKICEEAKKTAGFVEFRKRYDALNKSEFDGKSVVDFICTEDNAVAIAVILIIEGMDDTDIFEDYDMLIDALSVVDGEQSELAECIADFLSVDLFTSHTLEELLNEFF